MMSDGLLSRVARGVYALRPGGWPQLAWTAVLLAGPRAVIGGKAAAYLNELVPEPPAVIDCFVGAGGRRSHAGPWHFIRADRPGRGEPPRTTLIQTILDASRDMNDDEIASMLARAGRRVRQAEILSRLGEIERHPRRQALCEILGDVSQGAQSALEVRYARDVERPHGLPMMVRQRNPTGRARIDGLYESYGLIVEVDGRRYHSGLAASGDAARDNAHLLSGFVTMRFTWREVAGDPCRVAREVGAALNSRGWQGTVRGCRRCRVGLGGGFAVKVDHNPST